MVHSLRARNARLLASHALPLPVRHTGNHDNFPLSRMVVENAHPLCSEQPVLLQFRPYRPVELVVQFTRHHPSILQPASNLGEAADRSAELGLAMGVHFTV